MKNIFNSLFVFSFFTSLPFLNAATVNNKKTVLSVPAIVCMSCEAKVKSAVGKNHATDIAVSIEAKEVSFSCDAAKGCKLDSILKDLEVAKYPATLKTNSVN